MAAAFPQGSRWQYHCPFRKAWCDVGVEEDARLKDGYAACASEQKTLKYPVAGVRFVTDFAAMTRTNEASARTTELRLKGGELPMLPPPTEKSLPGPSSAPPAPEATAGAPDKPQGLEGAGATPDAVVSNTEDPRIPLLVSRAWGQGVPEAVTEAGVFEFTLQLEDKDRLGELLTRHMMLAGVRHESMDRDSLSFTDRRGTVARSSKDAVQTLLEKSASYPVKVKYAPKKMYQGFEHDKMQCAMYELTRINLKAVKDAGAEINWDPDNIKHRHHKKMLQRYHLYLRDQEYQNEDNLEEVMGMVEFCMRYPHAAGYFSLTSKTLPNLAKVLRGEVDIVEYLFGG
mmetsp:Transcript_10718/g.31692  ORF Transcript_10718/g.31692 Transcript_10718/m.31692 type:complete len:343 (-) Transcript_10718:49-1077(-)